jgi:hypothetical protein
MVYTIQGVKCESPAVSPGFLFILTTLIVAG